MARFWALGMVVMLAGLAVQPAAGQTAAGQTAAEQTAAGQTAAGQTAASTAVTAPPGFRASCARHAWLCDNRRAADGLQGARLLEVARRVNQRVNLDVTQLSDAENYGVADHWTLPANGRGDCEDIVLEKYRRLLAAGVDGPSLAVAVVLDRNGENHAVLVLRHASGDLVLDSLRPAILPWNETGYRFLAMQSARDRSRWEVVAGQPGTSPVLAAR